MQKKNQTEIGQALTSPSGERYLYETNGNRFHYTDSMTLYARRFENSLRQENCLNIIIGTDSGLLPNHLVTREIPSGSSFIFVELNGVIGSLTQQNMLNELPDQMKIVPLSALMSTADEFFLNDYIYLDSVFIRNSFSVSDASIEGYSQLAEQVRQRVNERAYDVIAALGSKNYINKQIANLTENQLPGSCLKALRHSFADKTAVILGGGPSLDDFLPWVQLHKEKLAIFAISRISKRLIETGLTPHAIFSIDPSEYNIHISREMFLFAEKPVLINANHLDPHLLGCWHGPKVYLGTRTPWAGQLNHSDNLEPWGPTVTNTALGAAVSMGFSQIILIGVDLCFNKQGLTHAQGNFERSAGPKLESTLTVTTNSGDTAETDADYFGAIKHFTLQAATAVDRGCRVVSPAPGAAKISNVDYCPIEEIEINPLRAEADKTILNALPKPTLQDRIDDINTVLTELNNARQQLKQVISLSEKGIKQSRKLRSAATVATAQKKIKDIEQVLNNELAPMSALVKQYGIRRFLKLTTNIPNRKKSGLDSQKDLIHFFNANILSSRELLTQLTDAHVRTTCRLEECKDSPDFGKIQPVWYKDNQLARVFAWREQRQDLKKMFAEKPLSDLLPFWQNWFEERFVNNSTPIQRSLDGIAGKIIGLFNCGDQKALSRLIEGLEIHPDQNTATALIHLIHGYLHELEGKLDVALESYQKLIDDEMTPQTEEALKRISIICLKQKNIAMAAVALECLSQISATYQPRYADLLCLDNRRHEAADIYTSYLEAYPADLETMIRLGQNYRAMGEEQAAQQIFNLILQQQPDHKAALQLLKNKVL